MIFRCVRTLLSKVLKSSARKHAFRCLASWCPRLGLELAEVSWIALQLVTGASLPGQFVLDLLSYALLYSFVNLESHKAEIFSGFELATSRAEDLAARLAKKYESLTS